MSYTTITQSTRDPALQDRVMAAVEKEAWIGEKKDTAFAADVRTAPSTGIVALLWPVAIDYEEQYEYAVNTGNLNPGGDVSVITDGNIAAAVVAHWPDDPASP